MYDPDKRTWTPMSNANAPLARDFATAVWADTKMIVWGGRDKSGNPLGDGATFDPTTNSWSNLPADASPRQYEKQSARR
jgi:N-acetylneuraminic acid mutarotase